MIRKSLFLFTLLLLLSTSCGDDIKSSLPNVMFDFECDMRQAAYSSLNTAGQFVSIDKNEHGVKIAYGGLIVGQSAFPGFDNEKVFYAFDKACPVEANRDITIQLGASGTGKAVCPKCKTEYDLNNGGVPKGTGTEYLKRYSITPVSEYVLHIQNR